VLDAASPVRTSSGLVAIARWSAASLADVFAAPGPALVVGLLGVQDPGNMGSAIRSANALGATGVVALDGCADPAGWKALRGAMGSTFQLPIARASLADVFTAAASHHVAVLATAARQGTPPERSNLRRPALLLFGAEGSGLDLDALPPSTESLTVPMESGVESLNVAVTVALLLYEARRQRTPAGPTTPTHA
jgi:TrmH family RNA methyltransferase